MRNLIFAFVCLLSMQSFGQPICNNCIKAELVFPKKTIKLIDYNSYETNIGVYMSIYNSSKDTIKMDQLLPGAEEEETYFSNVCIALYKSELGHDDVRIIPPIADRLPVSNPVIIPPRSKYDVHLGIILKSMCPIYKSGRYKFKGVFRFQKYNGYFSIPAKDVIIDIIK